MGKKILVVAVHPDDETLGCGGTLLKEQKQGNEIYWLIVTKGYTENGFSIESIENMSLQIDKVNSAFKFDDVFELELPTTQLDTIPLGNIISKISKVIMDIKPEVVYLPFIGDVHTDHKIVSQAAWSCLKSFRTPFVKEIYACEVISETDQCNPSQNEIFVPNTYVDISEFLDKKIEIANLYKSEIAPHPFPRSENSIKALAALRGAQTGVMYAEAFMCLRRIV